jgi:hypothetical protein
MDLYLKKLEKSLKDKSYKNKGDIEENYNAEEVFDKYLEKKPSYQKFLKEEKSKKSEVDLPKYTRSPYANYKLLEGKVMDAHSDLKIGKNGKRAITTKMKIWQQLTPRDKADLKRSIMLAIDHKFKGGSISDFPDDIKKTAMAVHKYFEGKGLFDKPIDTGRQFVGALKTSHTNLMGTLNKAKKLADERKTHQLKNQTKGEGFGENYFKPKGMRQLIYFSDSSSDEDEPHLPVKRGRGRPKCS